MNTLEWRRKTMDSQKFVFVGRVEGDEDKEGKLGKKADAR